MLLLGLVLATYQTGSAAPSDPSPPPKLAGPTLCIACHAAVPKQQEHEWHVQLIATKEGWHYCEECHGPSEAHAEDPEKVRTYYDVTEAPASRAAQACLHCHDDHVKAAQWKSSDHAQANVPCWGCHSQGSTPHEKMLRRPTPEACMSCHPDRRATFEMTTHHPVLEGRVECADCHNPHKYTTTLEKTQACLECHPDHRGPFIYEHGAINSDLTDGCVTCHRPHGSPNEHMLKFTGRGLCLQCHADHVLHHAGHICWDCHEDHHGSNTNHLFLHH